MKKISTQHLACTLFFVCAGVLAFAMYFFGFFMPSRLAYDEKDRGYNKEYWRHEIAKNGAEQAYGEFLEKNSLVPEARQHLFAHAMGEALFEERGIEAIVTCNDAFSFGCYHGFSARAIAEGGSDALMKFDAACTEKFGNLSGCTHGLGHGVLEYVGYENLGSALSMCTALVSQPTPLLGCTSGVFMEYLSPIQSGDEIPKPTSHTFDSAHPYAPCMEVSGQYQSSCYFELGQWFRQTPDTDYGALCGALSGSPKQNCFLGIGTDMTRGWKDAETLIARCARYDALGELACRAGAAWSLVGNGTAVELCAYADTEQKRACIETADLTQGLDTSIQESLR